MDQVVDVLCIVDASFGECFHWIYNKRLRIHPWGPRNIPEFQWYQYLCQFIGQYFFHVPTMFLWLLGTEMIRLPTATMDYHTNTLRTDPSSSSPEPYPTWSPAAPSRDRILSGNKSPPWQWSMAQGTKYHCATSVPSFVVSGIGETEE